MARMMLQSVLCALLLAAATGCGTARADVALPVVSRQSGPYPIYGPMGTYFNGEDFFNVLGHRLTSSPFDFRTDRSFVIEPEFRNTIYPAGFTWAHGKLIGAHGVYFSKGTFRTLGDPKRALPNNWFARRNGGFYVKQQFKNQLYPKGFSYRGGGLVSPGGLYYTFNVKSNRGFFYGPGPTLIPQWRFSWVNGGYYVKRSSLAFVRALLNADPLPIPGSAPATQKPPTTPTQTKPTQNVAGKPIGNYGIYYGSNAYRTRGDTKRVLPNSWFARSNGALLIKNQFIPRIYPKGFWYAKGGLLSRGGLNYFYNAAANRGFFYGPGPTLIPQWRFTWINGGYYVKRDSLTFVRAILNADPLPIPAGPVTVAPPVVKPPVTTPTVTGNAPANPTNAAGLPAGFELVQGRLFGDYGVYRYKGVYRTFGDDVRVIPRAWIREVNNVFYVKNQNVWQLYPTGYKWQNGGLKGKEGVWFRRVPKTLISRFYIVPSFTVLASNKFKWVDGGHLIKSQFVQSLAKGLAQSSGSGGSPHIPGTDGIGNGNAPPLVSITRPRPSRQGAVVKVVPHVGPRKRYEWINGKLYGPNNVVWDKTRFWTLGDWSNAIPANLFTVGNGQFTLKPGNQWRLYPKGFKISPNGVTSPELILFQRLPGKTEGTFFYPGGGVVPVFYFEWRKGGFFMKPRFKSFVLQG